MAFCFTHYFDFSFQTGTLTGIRVTHQVVYALCRAQKIQCELYPTREVVLSLDPYSGLSFTLWVLMSVHCGHHSILVPPSVTEVMPDLWLTICSQRKGMLNQSYDFVQNSSLLILLTINPRLSFVLNHRLSFFLLVS